MHKHISKYHEVLCEQKHQGIQTFPDNYFLDNLGAVQYFGHCFLLIET